MAISVYFAEANFTAKTYAEVIKRLEKAGLGMPKGRLYHASFGELSRSFCRRSGRRAGRGLRPIPPTHLSPLQKRMSRSGGASFRSVSSPTRDKWVLKFSFSRAAWATISFCPEAALS